MELCLLWVITEVVLSTFLHRANLLRILGVGSEEGASHCIQKPHCIFKQTRMAVGDSTAILFGGLWRVYFRFLISKC